MSFKTGYDLVKAHGVAARDEIKAISSMVFMVIGRELNGNVVVMEASVNRMGFIKKIEPFWLDLDPEYRKTNRLKKKAHDRDEFNFLDRRAYGVSVDKKNTKSWTFHFNQFPSKKFSVVVDSNGASCFTRDAKTNDMYLVHYLYVNHDKLLGLIPKVRHIDVVGRNPQTGKKVAERLKP